LDSHDSCWTYALPFPTETRTPPQSRAPLSGLPKFTRVSCPVTVHRSLRPITPTLFFYVPLFSLLTLIPAMANPSCITTLDTPTPFYFYVSPPPHDTATFRVLLPPPPLSHLSIRTGGSATPSWRAHLPEFPDVALSILRSPRLFPFPRSSWKDIFEKGVVSRGSFFGGSFFSPAIPPVGLLVGKDYLPLKPRSLLIIKLFDCSLASHRHGSSKRASGVPSDENVSIIHYPKRNSRRKEAGTSNLLHVC